MFPNRVQIDNADREQICRWYRFLPSGETAEDTCIINQIAAKFKKLGGFTPELSKKIGWPD